MNDKGFPLPTPRRSPPSKRTRRYRRHTASASQRCGPAGGTTVGFRSVTNRARRTSLESTNPNSSELLAQHFPQPPADAPRASRRRPPTRPARADADADAADRRANAHANAAERRANAPREHAREVQWRTTEEEWSSSRTTRACGAGAALAARARLAALLRVEHALARNSQRLCARARLALRQFSVALLPEHGEDAAPPSTPDLKLAAQTRCCEHEADQREQRGARCCLQGTRERHVRHFGTERQHKPSSGATSSPRAASCRSP